MKLSKDEKLAAYKRVWDALWWGEFRDARDISDEATVDQGRTCEFVREAVRWMRDHGLPVISGDNGFKKTTDPAEIAAFVRMMHAKAVSIHGRADRVLAVLEKGWGKAAHEENATSMFGGQLDLFDGED